MCLCITNFCVLVRAKKLTMILGLLPPGIASEISTGISHFFLIPLRFAKEFLNVFFKNNHSMNYFFRGSMRLGFFKGSFEKILQDCFKSFTMNFNRNSLGIS